MANSKTSGQARFERHLKFWRQRLGLLDLHIDVSENDKLDCQASIRAGHDGLDPTLAIIEIHPGVYALEDDELSSIALHELIHVICWPLYHATNSISDQFTRSQYDLISQVERAGNEAVTYRLERIFTRLAGTGGREKNERRKEG